MVSVPPSSLPDGLVSQAVYRMTARAASENRHRPLALSRPCTGRWRYDLYTVYLHDVTPLLWGKVARNRWPTASIGDRKRLSPNNDDLFIRHKIRASLLFEGSHSD